MTDQDVLDTVYDILAEIDDIQTRPRVRPRMTEPETESKEEEREMAPPRRRARMAEESKEAEEERELERARARDRERAEEMAHERRIERIREQQRLIQEMIDALVAPPPRRRVLQPISGRRANRRLSIDTRAGRPGFDDGI